MKVNMIKDFDDFFKVVNSCNGVVELITDEGDRLNLKSRLSQLVSLSNIMNDPKTFSHAEIVAHEPDDVRRIEKYLKNQ